MSSDLEIRQPSVPPQLPNRKLKKKTLVVPEYGKNEGDDPHWAYTPPEGAVPISDSTNQGAFDWDVVKDEKDIELWLIRIPDGLKTTNLDGVEIDLPTSSRTARIGDVKRKHGAYDVWSLGEGEEQPVGGEEIKTLSCLLPRKKKKGKLYRAAKMVTRHLVVAAQPVTAIPHSPTNPPLEECPARHRYSKEQMKHRFLPYGCVTNQFLASDVHAEPVVEEDVVDELKVKVEETSQKYPKKRKGEISAAEGPKKSKKIKIQPD